MVVSIDGAPNWMVENGKSQSKMSDLGVSTFMANTIWLCLAITGIRTWFNCNKSGHGSSLDCLTPAAAASLVLMHILHLKEAMDGFQGKSTGNHQLPIKYGVFL